MIFFFKKHNITSYSSALRYLFSKLNSLYKNVIKDYPHLEKCGLREILSLSDVPTLCKEKKNNMINILEKQYVYLKCHKNVPLTVKINIFS